MELKCEHNNAYAGLGFLGCFPFVAPRAFCLGSAGAPFIFLFCVVNLLNIGALRSMLGITTNLTWLPRRYIYIRMSLPVQG